MHNLTWAMGAEHLPQERLIKLVDIMSTSTNTKGRNRTELERIADTYGADVLLNVKYDMYRYVDETKIDGFSYISDAGRFFSKKPSSAKGKEGEPIEKTGHVPHLSRFIKTISSILDMDLHGELYVPGGISDDVTKIMGCGEDEAVRRQAGGNELHYMLIDIRRFGGHDVTNEPYYVRRAILEHVYNNYLIQNQFIHLIDVDTSNPRGRFREIVTNGGEGLVIKRTDAIYIPGKKPMDIWIKCKKKITFEAVIMGYKPGTGKNASMFGSFKFGLYIDNKLTECGYTSSGLDDATRKVIAADPDGYIGKVIEIEAMQESVRSYRNACFVKLRPDKAAHECTPLNVRVKVEIV